MLDEHRRWDDLMREIDMRIPPAVRSAMVEYRIVVDETARNTAQLMTVVFGSPSLGVRGMVERMGALETKIDTLIEGQTQREKDWEQMRAFLGHENERKAVQHVISRNVGRFNVLAGLFGGFMTIVTLLQLFHIISL